MARRLQAHHARQEAIQAFTRQLVRRARSACELCTTANTALSPVEVTPLEDDPDPERTVLICERCARGVARPDKLKDPHAWRFLEVAMWSDLPPAQVLAVRLLRHLGPNVPWAREALDTLYLDPEIEAWVDAG